MHDVYDDDEDFKEFEMFVVVLIPSFMSEIFLFRADLKI